MQIRQCHSILRSFGNSCSWTRPPEHAENHCTKSCRNKLLSRFTHSSRELLLTDSKACAANVKLRGNNRTCYMALSQLSSQDCENKRLNCDNFDLRNNMSAIDQAVSKCDIGLADLQNIVRRRSLCDGDTRMSAINLRCRAFQRYMTNGKKYMYMTLRGGHKCMLNQYSSVGSIPSQNQNCKQFHSSVTWSHNEWGMRVRTEPPWRVLFFGTDRISVETLKRLHDSMHSGHSVVESLEVVANKEKREVRRYSEEKGLKIYDWPIQAIPNKYDVGVLVSFGHLIPDDIIHMFPYGILNMHPSLLPRWRGASPIIHTILNGDPETGISIMEIRPKHFDIGPLLMHRRFPVPYRCTSLQLAEILAPIGADMIVETLADLRTLERFEEEQDTSGIRYAHKLIPKNANIDWENQTCDDIDHQFRAISEVKPLRSEWRGHIVKMFDMLDPDITNKPAPKLVRGYKEDLNLAVPGTPAYHTKQDCILVKCKDGVVGFKSLSIRKPMTAKDFLGGYLTPPDGSIFVSLENDLNKFVKTKQIPVLLKAKI